MKVAIYCRISTDKDDQENSFEAQKRYFSDVVSRSQDWELHEIYADEGISGTSTKKRTQFLRMINDAYDGKYDMIITKEVSRFSRNIVDTITYTRDLKAIGVGVLFVNDGINTLDPDAELRLSIMATIAQEESRKTSSRVIWGQTRQMERGVVFGPSLLGYDVAGGRLTINEEGAALVRLIFHMYAVEQVGTTEIARFLTKEGYQTSRGCSVWKSNKIVKILNNEKYVGDLAQGQTYTPDPMTHKKKYNRGESDTFYIKDHHPESAIIERELWDRVQKRLIENAPPDEIKAKHNNRYWLSGKVYCGICGGRYVSLPKKQKNIPYKAWVCFANHQRGRQKEIVTDLGETITVGCNAKRVNERVLLIALKDLLTYYLRDEKDNLVNAILARVTKVQTQKVRTSELEKLQRKLDGIKVKKSRLLDKLLDEIVSKADYTAKNSELEEQMEIIQAQINELNSNSKAKAEIAELLAMKQQVEEMAGLDDADINEVLFGRVTKKIVVHPDNILEIHLSILPEPVFLRYETTGKGTEYTAIFDVVPNPNQ